jgi:hypothetical protein
MEDPFWKSARTNSVPTETLRRISGHSFLPRRMSAHVIGWHTFPSARILT